MKGNTKNMLLGAFLVFFCCFVSGNIYANKAKDKDTGVSAPSNVILSTPDEDLRIDYNNKCVIVGENAELEFYVTNNSGKIIEDYYLLGSCSGDLSKAIDDQGNEYVVSVKFGNSGGNCYIADNVLLKGIPVKVVLTIEKVNRNKFNYFTRIAVEGRPAVYAYDPPRKYQGVFVLENIPLTLNKKK